LALLEAGEFFGEMSFVDGAPDECYGYRPMYPRGSGVIDEATVNGLTKKDPAFCGAALSLDCRHSRGAASAHLDAPSTA